MNKKEKFYWKVVYPCSNGKLGCAALSPCKYYVNYGIGIRSKALFQGLFVFETREQARQWKNTGTEHKIFKCRVFGNEVGNPIYCSLTDLESGIMRETDAIFPKGTKCFPEVELVSPQ